MIVRATPQRDDVHEYLAGAVLRPDSINIAAPAIGIGTPSFQGSAYLCLMSDPTANVRVDAWTWAVRLFATRSMATDACRAGHVRVNGARVKPAHPVRIGDTVRALTAGGERIVVVTGLLSKRVAAAVAVQQYQDNSPPPLPRELRPSPIIRDPGAGRPTKRERRRLDRLRHR